MAIKITIDKSCVSRVLFLLGIKGVNPKRFGALFGGKVYGNDLPSIIELADDLEKAKGIGHKEIGYGN
jgi:hypothetical protein